MKVWYLGLTGIQEESPIVGICNKGLFKSLKIKCFENKLFDNLHPCCSRGKYYREITESNLFNL